MKYAIIGSGKVGSTLARFFEQHKIEVGIANSRGPASLASLAKEFGSSVVPQTLEDACKAEMIFLAVPFSAHKDVAKQRKQWDGKIIVDTMNTLDLSPEQREELGGILSSEVVSKAFAVARVVKAFNHLPAKFLGTNPAVNGHRQVVFVSSNDADASSAVATVVTQLGFAPIELGRLDQGGVPLHLLDGGHRGALLFQNLIKLG